MDLTNKHFVSRKKEAHDPEPLIQFLTHVPRSLSLADAFNLAAYLTVLLDNDQELAKYVAALRAAQPKPKAASAPPAGNRW